MTEYATLKWWAYLVDTWTDITEYVMQAPGVRAGWGMRSNAENARLADAGDMTLTLFNNAGKFSPPESTALSGWDKGTKIVLTAAYDGSDYVKYYGTVSQLKLNEFSASYRTVTVVVSDWMYYTGRFPIKATSIVTFRRADQAAEAVVGLMNTPPRAAVYHESVTLFDALFDTTTTRTMANTEMNKIVLGEGGYLYRRCDRLLGETIVFEDAYHRSGLVPLSQIPKLAADCGYLLDEDGEQILDEDGNAIIADEAEDCEITGTLFDKMERSHGDNILNRVKVTAYPKRVDTTEQVLFSLGSPIALAPGETKTFTGKYVDPSGGGAQVNAISSAMVEPVATTDYLMNRSKLGTSTNITAYLTVSVVYGTAAPIYTVKNTSTYTGYVIKLQARGYGVYQDNPIYIEVEDADSQDAYGVCDLSIEQQYQRDIVRGEGLAATLLYLNKNPVTKLDRLTMTANNSSKNMLAFLTMDVGDKVNLNVSALELDGDYYIQGVEFEIRQGGVIVFSWILKGVEVYTDISLDFGDEDSAVVFKRPDKMLNLQDKTWILSVNLNNPTPAYKVNFIGGLYAGSADGRGWNLLRDRGAIGYDKKLIFQRLQFGSNATWVTTTATLEDATACRIALTFSNDANAPVMYVDGSAVALTELVAVGAGFSFNEDFLDLNLGYATSTADESESKCLVYNRILTADEVAADAASPGSITDGLVFAGPAVPTRLLDEYDNEALDASKPVFDRIYGVVGIPSGDVTGQLIP